MQNRQIQMVLAAANYYSGGIDGIIGTNSRKAVAAVELKHKAAYSFDPTGSTQSRRLVAATQAALNELGHDAGTVDGWEGEFTREALNRFLFKTVNGKDEVIDRTPLPTASAPASIPKQSAVGTVYGNPETQIASRLVTIRLPFKLRIDWNLRQRTNKITVHKDAAPSLEAALIAVRNHYGDDQMTELSIDRYAGAYNKRKMRGGTKWSMHAYGCAIDFFAAPNGLRTQCPDALFCGAAYKPFLDIMESHEWLPAIRLWGKDAM